MGEGVSKRDAGVVIVFRFIEVIETFVNTRHTQPLREKKKCRSAMFTGLTASLPLAIGTTVTNPTTGAATMFAFNYGTSGMDFQLVSSTDLVSFAPTGGSTTFSDYIVNQVFAFTAKGAAGPTIVAAAGGQAFLSSKSVTGNDGQIFFSTDFGKTFEAVASPSDGAACPAPTYYTGYSLAK